MTTLMIVYQNAASIEQKKLNEITFINGTKYIIMNLIAPVS